jgi:hypothetical protein
MWIYLTCLTDSTSSAASEELVMPLNNGLDQLPIAKSTHIVQAKEAFEILMGLKK